MKSAGITRGLDNMGRIVIPKETRILMGIHTGDPLEIFMDVESKTLALRRHVGVSCKMCGSPDQLIYFRGSFLCADCSQDMKEGKVEQVPNTTEEVKSKKRKTQSQKYYKTNPHLLELKRLMAEHPAYTQNKYAKMMGVSPAQVSFLKRKIITGDY